MIHPDIWQESWAYPLLQYHPEYDYLLYTNAVCELTSSSVLGDFNSDGFDAFLQSITTFSDALSKNLLNDKTSINTKDPYFLNAL